eukprot:TRINITY_DN123589_c0_g1_i1.p2 TRINITY_DN123589_c0_g1~~TRINITY_DN123589_c0_g1_i1.p2  ORF type:complete len:288 (+),score=33.75 TRINITY_DN123589_c0_g1_i1:1641-2504(+)
MTTTKFLDPFTLIKFLKEYILLYASAQQPKYSFYLSAFSMLYRYLHNILGGKGPFQEEKVWTLPSMTWTLKDITVKTVLEAAPFMAPFKVRYKLFQDSIKEERTNISSGGEVYIKIRRELLFKDALELLNTDAKIKKLKKVQFVNKLGLPEVGVDAGGLFKEFFVELCKTVFNPKFGLFKETDERELYPNPGSSTCFKDNHLQYYRFIGKILSKAVYESIVIEPQFADFFLRKMLGKPIDYKDLKSFDSELYKHLITLKNMEFDVRDLELTFTAIGEDKVQILNGKQ